MLRGTWPLLGDNVCNWQHFSISAAIWFSTGLQETQSTISCSPSIIVIVHSNLGPGRLFYRRIGWQRLKWLLAGSPQVAKAGRRRKRCAMTLAHRWRAARQRTALRSLLSSSPFWNSPFGFELFQIFTPMSHTWYTVHRGKDMSL